MLKPQFIINYIGNKYDDKETQNILEFINFDKYDTIIEPFAGSFGFSRYCYKDLDLKDIKYIFYDTDEKLINFYKELQKYNIDDIYKFIDIYNNKVQFCIDNKYYTKKKDNNRLIYKKDYHIKEYFNDNEIVKYMCYYNIFASFKRFIFKKNVEKKFINLILNADFKLQDFNTTKFKSNKKQLIYIDSPYLNTDNSHYKNCSQNNVKIIIDNIIKLFKSKNKSSLIFIHIKNDYIEEQLEEFKILEYDKLYHFKKKRVKHIFYGKNL